jgi:hypothetical protein
VPTLVIVGEDGSERTVELTQRDFRIGRAPENDLVLPDPTKGVSRMHAELRFENGQYVIIDLNSQNGTWVDGNRVQRAEIAPNAEIEVGPYRLKIRAPAARPMVDTQIVEAPRPTPEVSTATLVTPAPIPSAPAVGSPAAPGRKPPRPAPRGRETTKPGLFAALARMPKPLLFGGFLVVMAVIIVLGMLSGSSETSGSGPVKSSPADQKVAAPSEPQKQAAPPAEPPAASPPPADAGSPPPTPPADSTPPTAAPAPPPAQSAEPQVTAPPPAQPPPVTPTQVQVKPVLPVPASPRARNPSPGTNASRGAKPSEGPVARRPGESVQAWRGRAAALQAKYSSASEALTRGEYATAAAGFDALLKEEPSYLDAPQLYIRAREGQRGSARDAFEAGNKLDAAGDWTGALQKYDLARQIDPSLAGLDDAGKRVREKMRVAGADAYKRARQYDALGRSGEALKDYERAAQWLAADDPNRKAARDRADQLKAGLK